jgi:hypothetical protein
LQIVAAIGKLLGGGLNELLDEWASLDYGAELDTLKQKLVEATEIFKEAATSLKDNEREVIDYYAADLTDMAVYVLCSWLLLRDARHSERKREMARVYIIEHLPQVHSAHAAIRAADATPLEARAAILAGPF